MLLPEHMRIGRNALSKRVSLVRSDIVKDWSAGGTRNKVDLRSIRSK